MKEPVKIVCSDCGAEFKSLPDACAHVCPRNPTRLAETIELVAALSALKN